ncbi:MAG: right-handed parallel beta-helix repeat-containing protein [Candidatus Aenigmarchaeota archaeon]|nr:right-handed parallel beta-helix repeat-containing protein [Candidatus Aenigmarchaeota archaeon]
MDLITKLMWYKGDNMTDYSKLGLTPNLQSINSPISRKITDATEIDMQNGISPGLIDYSRITSSGRAYQAIISSSKSGGAFTDIQDAFDYVNRLGGGKILLRTGTYNVTSNINFYSNIYLEGDDADTAVINFGSTNSGIQCVGTTNGTLSNISISNIGITNAWAGTPNGAIVINYCNDILVEKCRFQSNGSSTNLAHNDINIVGNSSRIYILENRFIEGPTTLYVGAVSDIFFNENTINSSWGFLVEDVGTATQLMIKNNIINKSGTNADALIFLESPGPRLMIEGNRFINPQTDSIYIGNTIGAVVSNNIIDGNSNSLNGIIIADGALLCSITGNVVIRCTSGTAADGVQIQNSNYNIISGNAFGSNSGYGITITGGTASSTNVVTGNIFRTNTQGTINDAGTLTVISGNGGA